MKCIVIQIILHRFGIYPALKLKKWTIRHFPTLSSLWSYKLLSCLSHTSI